VCKETTRQEFPIPYNRPPPRVPKNRPTFDRYQQVRKRGEEKDDKDTAKGRKNIEEKNETNREPVMREGKGKKETQKRK